MVAARAVAIPRTHIVRSPEDFDRFLAGEVLVAMATAPAWTPLFARAAAVVTDGASLAAHASLVARANTASLPSSVPATPPSGSPPVNW